MYESPSGMSNTVLFELPVFVDVDEFCERIRSRWPGSKEREDDIWLVSARVRTGKNDLARLLREVEAYVADSELHAIRYQLDGRFYVMEAPAAFDLAASF
jgi:hypothetical protein